MLLGFRQRAYVINEATFQRVRSPRGQVRGQGPAPGGGKGARPRRARGRRAHARPLPRPEPGFGAARPGERIRRGTGRRCCGGRAAKLERRWRRRREAGAGAEAGATRPAGRQAAAARGSSPEAGAAAMAESIVSGAAGRERAPA